MEHTIATFRRDIEREAARSDFLENAVRSYAPHAWNDIKDILAKDYPRAIHRTSNTDDDE